jgi:hypothetical protein
LACRGEEFPACLNQPCRSFRLQRHGRHGGIEMAAMKIYSEDGRNDFVDSEIHSSFSFVSQRGRFNKRRRPDDLTYASFKELTS